MVRVIILAVLLAMQFASVPAHASEAELQEAYTAYQVAAEEGDLRSALPHAQRAYELGLELYGPESRNTGLLAFNYGYVLVELRDFPNAIDSLIVSRSALQASDQSRATPEMFETVYELSRAYANSRDIDWNSADRAAQDALEVAQSVFGESSHQSGLAHLQIAYNAIPSVFRRREVPTNKVITHYERRRSLVVPNTNRLTSTLTEMFEHMVAFQEEILRYPNLELAISMLDIDRLEPLQEGLLLGVQGYYAGMDFEFQEYNKFYSLLFNLLAEHSIANDEVINLLVNWQLARGVPTDRGPVGRYETLLGFVDEFARNRVDGTLIPTQIGLAVYPEEAEREMATGDVVISFYVNEAGTTSEIQILQSDATFDSAAMDAVRGWVFIPASRHGVLVSSGPFSTTFNFRAERQSLTEMMGQLDSFAQQIYFDELAARGLSQ